MSPTALEVGLGLLPLAGDLYSAKAMRDEARKNREFQERMSSTAHQREVKDLIAAGLNPALSAMRGGGASSPGGSVADVPDFGGSAGRGISSALVVQRQKAEIDLLKRQADREAATTSLTLKQAEQFHNLMAGETELQRLSITERRQMIPMLVEQAKASIRQSGSSARHMEALAMLAELEKTGYVNTQKFEEYVGTMGPTGRALLEIIKTLRRPK